MPTYRIDFGYDGTGFKGFARNEGVRTVQGELEDALARVLGETVATTAAGRTDAGVHAVGQVVSFQAGDIDLEKVERSLRSMLRPEISVTTLIEASDGFDARFSARSRVYRYRIDDRPAADPLTRATVWHVAEPLDLEPMTRAAQHFVGSHDFASLCRAREGKSTERTVFSAQWRRIEALLEFEVEALAFCHQMVRSMVALCVDVGRGKVSPDAVPRILEARDRHAARGVAPPHGLVLWGVRYD